MSMDYMGIGRRADRSFEVDCQRCGETFYGVREGDTGSSYLTGEGPVDRPCALCGAETDICGVCLDMMPAPLCKAHDAEDFTTQEVATMLGISRRMAQEIGAKMGKSISPRERQFIWTVEEIRHAARRDTKRGPKARE